MARPRAAVARFIEKLASGKFELQNYNWNGLKKAQEAQIQRLARKTIKPRFTCVRRGQDSGRNRDFVPRFEPFALFSGYLNCRLHCVQLKLFVLPVKNPGAAEAEMNGILRGHRVLAVKKEFLADGENSFRTFCGEHLEGSCQN